MDGLDVDPIAFRKQLTDKRLSTDKLREDTKKKLIAEVINLVSRDIDRCRSEGRRLFLSDDVLARLRDLSRAYPEHDFTKIRVGNSVFSLCLEPTLTKVSHKQSVDINNIVDKHTFGGLGNFVANLPPSLYQNMIDKPDFQQMSDIIARGQQAFDSLPAKIRDRFYNNPAVFWDFFHNKENVPALVEMGILRKDALKDFNKSSDEQSSSTSSSESNGGSAN